MITRCDVLRWAAGQPYPVAVRLRQWAEAPAPDRAIFACESLLRFVAVVAKSAYLVGPGEASVAVNEAIERNLFVPSTGSWVNFLRQMGAYWRNEPSACPSGDLLSLVVLLGGATGSEVARWRNCVLGHVGSVLGVEQQAAILVSMDPLLHGIFEAASVLGHYPLVVLDDASGRWRCWVGPGEEGIPTTEPQVPESCGVAIRGLSGGDLPLFPFILGTPEGYLPDLPGMPPETLLVFDGVELGERRKLGGSMVYMGQFGRGRLSRWFPEYQHLLESRHVPTIPISKGEASSRMVRQRCQAALDRSVERLRDERPGSGSVTRLNPAIAGLLDDAFVSVAPMVVLTGEAGLGKTTHLVGAAERWGQAGHPTLVVDSCFAREAASSPVESVLHKAFQHQLMVLASPGDIIERLANGCADVSGIGPRVALILDGLDEVTTVAGVARIVEELCDFLDGLPDERTKSALRIFLGLRASCWLGVWANPSTRRRLESRLYRPTTREPLGERASSSIWIRPLTPREAETQYEAYREQLPGCRPLSSWTELSCETRESARNPRWMVQLLSDYHGRTVPVLSGGLDLWRRRLRDIVYDTVETPSGVVPLHPARARIVDALVEAQTDCGLSSVRKDDLEALLDEGLQDWTRESGAAFYDILSEGLIRIAPPPGDTFGGLRIEPVSPDLTVAMHLEGPIIRTLRPETGHALMARVDGTSLAPIVARAVVQRLAVDCQGEMLPFWSPTLALVGLQERAELCLCLAQKGQTSQSASVLEGFPLDERESICRSLLALAWGASAQTALEHLTNRLMSWSPTCLGPAAVELVARIMRHLERIAEVENWLLGLRETHIFAHALLHLAEVRREKGRWTDAIRAYSDLAEQSGQDGGVKVRALAGRGECYIWLQDFERAFRDLDAAESALQGENDAWLKCIVALKKGVAARVAGRLSLASKCLTSAESIAESAGFSTELAKCGVELALVAAELGGFEEARVLLSRSHGIFDRQCYIKGQKKAWYCLGYVEEKAGCTEAALAAYRTSLELNRQYYDPLGMERNHEALARVLSGVSPDEARQHLAGQERARANRTRPNNAETEVSDDFFL